MGTIHLNHDQIRCFKFLFPNVSIEFIESILKNDEEVINEILTERLKHIGDFQGCKNCKFGPAEDCYYFDLPVAKKKKCDRFKKKIPQQRIKIKRRSQYYII